VDVVSKVLVFMTCVEELARFSVNSSFQKLSKQTVDQLKIRVLDSLGCGIGALSSTPVGQVRKVESEFDGSPLCTLIGGGKPRLTEPPSSMVHMSGIWTSTTAFSPRGKPATQATTLPLCLAPPSTLTRLARIFW
jgi:hypothetical protein